MDTYEKKYNEALERFKAFKEKYYTKDTFLGDAIFDKTGEMQRDFESIFQELRESESEDEKIRKAIRLILIATEDEQRDFYATHKLTRKDCTDWLEKQKEQKPDIEPEEEVVDNLHNYLYGEQKPAEKQDYSGLNDLERAIHRGFLSAGVENVHVTIIKETAQDCLAHMPAWSEEDEKIRKLLIWQVYRNIEDETNDLARSVYDGIKGHDPDLEESIEDWKKCLAFLKALRPGWKPTEEQMEALYNVFYTCSVGAKYRDILESLYEQLKKL